MNTYLDKAKSELKRADHLIFVSLKYTRTVDVIRSIIERLINALEHIIDHLIEKNKDKVDEIPELSPLKCKLLKEIYPNNEKINEGIAFYLQLRKIIRAKYKAYREYRRHVNMKININDEDLEINIDNIKEYFEKTKEYMKELEGDNE